jgi:ComF family protein
MPASSLPAPRSSFNLTALTQRPGALLRRWLAPRCTLCGTQPGDPVCNACAEDFLPVEPRCPRCATRAALDGASACGRCLRDPPAFDATLALADYAPPLDALIVRLKFGHRLDLAYALGTLLGRALAAHAHSFDLLLPVPLAFERQRERGFNQALEIARVAARHCGRPLAQPLARVRHQPPQEGLTLDDRRRNVRGAFAVTRDGPAAIDGRRLLVVDDVMTSGSTLDEAARVLKRAGAATVANAVVARTP